ncbi:MAG TPA: DUF1214 domain-containing protein [Tepidisphaeraceae bacterium]|jgi:hypothetical protein
MNFRWTIVAALAAVLAACGAVQAEPDPPITSEIIPVTVDNFIRAETDTYFAKVVKQRTLGDFHHNRELTPIDQQNVIRMNRDTLYSAAVFDLNAGVVTITLPDPGERFMSMQMINQDHYCYDVVYQPGTYSFSREKYVTRYLMMAIRILVDPNKPGDLEQVHALQNGVRIVQHGEGPGTFEIPKWEPVSQKKVRDALIVLGSTVPDSKRMFGRPDDIDPVRHLIGTAMAWGGNPEKEATYLNVTPKQNDGKTPYRLTVKDVPVDGFWSISVYNAKGYFEPNPQNLYTLNNLTAQKSDDGSVAVQFGGDSAKASNWLPITAGWNYIVRLYRPRQEIIDGTWKFPDPQPVK